jgi:hypothetical protein
MKRKRPKSKQGLLGHDVPPEKVVLRGMADLEKTLARRFEELKKQRAGLAEANAPLRDKLLGVLGKDSGRAASVRRELHATRKPLARMPISIPKTLQQKRGPRVLVGLNGGTRVLPFDYSWSWSAKGGPTPQGAIDVGADPTNGNIWVNLNTGYARSVIARAAVGIFFRLPLWSLANFSLWSNPTVSFHWQQSGSGTEFSDGFVGLLAASYGWAGNAPARRPSPRAHRFSAILVDQMVSLWCGNPGDWGGSGDSSFPLSANFLVDSDHWYVLWVWCGSSVLSLSGGSEMSDLWVFVPSISWQFDGLQPPLQPLPALP